MDAPVLSCRGMSVQYGGNVAVADIDVTLCGRTLIAVLGANGAGKSSLVNALAGWSRGRPAVGGTVMLASDDVSALSAHARASRGLLLVSESRNVFGQLTVDEHFRLVRPPKNPSGRFVLSQADVLGLFPRLGERRDHTGSQLSGGERQMLAISCSLLAGPRALLLDEPSIGLAPLLVSEIFSRVRELVDRGLAVILVEQNASAALAVADEAILLERGRATLAGPAATLRDDGRIAEAYLGGKRKDTL